jgi:hypothetical protein
MFEDSYVFIKIQQGKLLTKHRMAWSSGRDIVYTAICINNHIVKYIKKIFWDFHSTRYGRAFFEMELNQPGLSGDLTDTEYVEMFIPMSVS